MYIPKSQIKSNLFTEGGEFARVDNNLSYKGHYYKTSKGKFYTGKTPEEGLNIELILEPSIALELPNFQSEGSDGNDSPYLNFIAGDYTYTTLKNVDTNQVKNIPQNIFPTPQPQDYINESFVRYFTKKRNAVKYLEIDKKTYDKLLSQDPTYLFELYRPLKLNWQVSGDKIKTYQTNENQTALLSRREKLEGFIEYFKGNFNQLYAQYTQGNTYVVANNGKSYTGFYHVMGDGQVMTGKSHTNKGINLVLRGDYVEQENPPLKQPTPTLNQETPLTVDEKNILIPSTTPPDLPPKQSYTQSPIVKQSSNSSY
tara:strand:+ start:1186 stop:2124 length:939 start_codon:yes stop_codon:yes gene_type:complete